MTTQAGAAIATAAQQPPTAKKVKARRNWGDLLLRIVAGLVLLYLFLPIFVIVLFSFTSSPRLGTSKSWQMSTSERVPAGSSLHARCGFRLSEKPTASAASRRPAA